MNLLVDIQSYLISKGIIQGDGIDCFRDVLPEAPDNIVALLEYEGVTEFVANRSVQVLVRHTDYELGRQKCLEIFHLVENPYSPITEITPQRWAILKARQPAFKLKTDNQNRTVWAFNLSAVTYND